MSDSYYAKITPIEGDDAPVDPGFGRPVLPPYGPIVIPPLPPDINFPAIPPWGVTLPEPPPDFPIVIPQPPDKPTPPVGLWPPVNDLPEGKNWLLIVVVGSGGKRAHWLYYDKPAVPQPK